MLVALAVNGPMHVRALGRLLDIDSGKAFGMVSRLVAAGLVVKRAEPGYRKLVALNKAMGWTYYLLRDLLLALNREWKVPQLEGHQQPREMWNGVDGRVTSKHLDEMFQGRVRSRALLYVAAVGQTNMQTMYEALGMGSVSAVLVVRSWERQGVLRSQRVGRERIVELDPTFFASEELRRLLMRLVSLNGGYRGHRAVVKRRTADAKIESRSNRRQSNRSNTKARLR